MKNTRNRYVAERWEDAIKTAYPLYRDEVLLEDLILAGEFGVFETVDRGTPIAVCRDLPTAVKIAEALNFKDFMTWLSADVKRRAGITEGAR